MMSSSMVLCVGCSVLAVFISACSQVLLKKEAMQEHESKIREYLNIRVALAYSIFIVATLLSIVAMRVIPLSLDSVIQTMGYIYVWFFGVKFFREKVSINKIIGMVMIIMGILIYSVFG